MRIFGWLIMLILIGWFPEAQACRCELKEEFKTRKDLAEYDFIARVKITRIDSVPGLSKRPLYHKIQFDLLEYFKGAPRNELLVFGGHLSLDRYTSCDLGEAIGDEWVLFAYMDQKLNKTITHLCTRTYRYVGADGYQERRYETQQKNLELLRTLFNKPVEAVVHDGPFIENYPNGKKSVEANYVNGKLTGERTLWYPDGALESRQHFKNGLKEGVFLWYSRKGHLLTREKFRDGHPVDTTTHWFPMDTAASQLDFYASLHKIPRDSVKQIYAAKRISMRHVYDEQGRHMHSWDFSWNGKINSESHYDPKTQMATTCYYHLNGTLSSKVNRKNWVGPGSYSDWNDQGKLVQTGTFNSKGDVIEKSVKYYP